MLHTEEGEKPCNVIEIAEPMLIKEEQSLNSWSGRSFAQEYSLATRGLVSHLIDQQLKEAKRAIHSVMI